ncbi:hypothetical protein Hanom_Chr10g00877751 [Helianthus anomalus]
MVCGEDLRTRPTISRDMRFKKKRYVYVIFLNSKHIPLSIYAHLQILFYGLEFISLVIMFIKPNTDLILF